MTNKNYLFIIAAGLFTVILSMVLIKMIFDQKIEIDQDYKVYMDKTFVKYNVLKGENKVFPNVVFYDPRGKPLSIEAFRGKYVLLNFWATWCPGCVVELPHLEKLREYIIQKEYPMALVAVSLDREKNGEDLAQFLVDHKVGPFALYHDRDSALLRAYPVEGMPTTLLIDPDGKVLYEFMGEADWTNYFIIKFLRQEMRHYIEMLDK